MMPFNREYREMSVFLHTEEKQPLFPHRFYGPGIDPIDDHGTKHPNRNI